MKEIADKEIAKGIECVRYEIPTETINNIIKNNFDSVPDILALDAEGLEYDILESWDEKLYPFKIVICEQMDEVQGSIVELMKSKGYYEFARTPENVICIKNDYEIFV